MVNEFCKIPNHSRAAISEGCDAAILRAAFLQLEEEEIMKYTMETVRAGHKDPRQLEFARNLRRRAHRRAARQAAVHILPRAAQAVACLIAVLAVGMGVALAASPAARSWAAGVLHAEIYEEMNIFAAESGKNSVPTRYWGDEPLSGFRGGASLGDALYLAGGVNSDDDIYVQTPGASQYGVYKKTGSEDRELMNLTAFGDGLYALCAEDADADWFGGDANDAVCASYSIGRVRFSEDGYAVEAPRTLNLKNLFGNDTRKPTSAAVQCFCADGDSLYLLYEWSYPSEGWSGESHCGLLRYNPVTGALDEIVLPEGNYLGWEGALSAFSGRDGRAYLALSEDAVQTTRILRIEADGSLSPLSGLPYKGNARACAFAVNSAGDTLYFLQERCVYGAPISDPSLAHPIATTGQTYGSAVLIDDSTLAIVNDMNAQIYVLSDEQAEITQLCVDGHGGNYFVETRFAESHPGINLVGDPCFADSIKDGTYLDAILAGQSQADVWLLPLDELPYLLDAGTYAEIDDPELTGAALRMYSGLQREIFRDGKLAAVPLYGYSYADFSFDPNVMKVLNLSDDALPETWAELLDLLIELSRSPQSHDFCLNDSYASADEFSRMLFNLISNAYLRLCRYENRTADFSDPGFESLAALWRQIDFDAFRYARRDMPDNTVEGTLLYSDDIYNYEPWAIPRTLRFDAQSPLVSRCSGIAAVVNPESARGELAYDYIRLYFSDSASIEDRSVFDAYSEPNAMTDDANCAAWIARMRTLAGDLTVVPSAARENPDAWAQAEATARAYAGGEITFAALAEALNASLA